jgi:phosphoglycerol transferase MdoB-like AlkP superfamily enzyme
MPYSAKEICRLLKGSLCFALVRRVLTVYILFTLCRAGFYLYNIDLYGEHTFGQLLAIFLGGLRFDTTAILYTNLLYILMFLIPFRFRYHAVYQNIAKTMYFVVNGIALAANCSDIVYFRFIMRRTTFDVFKEFEENENIGNVFASALIDYWPVLLLFIIMAAAMVCMYGPQIKYPETRSLRPAGKPVFYYPARLLVRIAGLMLIVVGIRGHLNVYARPLALNDAGAYAQTAIDMPLIQNTVFSVIMTIQKQGIVPLIYFEDNQELESVYSPIFHSAPEKDFTGENVVFIILEGFSREVVGSLNPQLHREEGYKSCTPFIDSLAQQGRAFIHAYSNGKNSVDAMPAALLGIPAISGHYTLSMYVNNTVQSLPGILRDKGYETAFFCGHPNGSQGYVAFTKLIGFNHYFGMNEYGNRADFDGTWGIYDEEFLQFAAKEINQLSPPFFTTIFTVSSHHPYSLPQKYEDIFHSDNFLPHRLIRYTDYSLRRFFNTVSKQPWFNNTLFVIMSDHPGEATRAEYKTTAGTFAIPVIFYRPDGSLRKEDCQTAQQLDITPTVLSYLNYDQPYLSFGFDLNRDEKHFAVNYLNGIYQIFRDNYILTFDGEKTTGMYDLRQDILMTDDLREHLPEAAQDLERTLKAFLQQYTTRMVENKLTVFKQ